MKTWKQHSGFIAWPTLLLTALLWTSLPLVWVAALTGWIPMLLGSLLATLLIYAAFTPMHEASHGNIGGRTSLAALDTFVGWGCSLLFLAPYPTFKAIHLRHHGTVNRVGRDPDLWVAGDNALTIGLRCLTMIPHYYRLFLGPMASESPQLRQARNIAAVALVGIGAAVVAATALGHGLDLLILWIVPAWLASGMLAFTLDWLPHHPHTSTERFTNARIIESRGLTVLLLWQNYHLIHHLWPKVPFYRYARVFDAEREMLASKGSPVDRWGLH